MSLHDDVVGALVLVGSLVLVGPLVFAVVGTAVDAGLAVAGVEGPLRLAGAVVPLTLALYTAHEVAVVDADGWGALWRGTHHEVVLRHALLSGVALLALVEVAWVGLGALSWSIGSPTTRLVGAIAVLVEVATVGVLVLFGLGVSEGYRDSA